LSDRAQLLVFRVDQRRFALPLAVTERVIRAVDVTPLPGAPAIVLGAIDVHGQVVPVLNVRRRFLLPEREVIPSDWFLLAHTTRHTVALVVDESDGVAERPQDEVVASIRIVPGAEAFPGVVRLDDELVLIHDLERFLSLDEERALDDALKATS
jgi:purine-binding chemotaxis protein CheW